jgi:protein-S-isoprenylcysteine O-methyltransferase Ste14
MIGFALLHSILARNCYFKTYTGHLHRTIYNVSTCGYLLVGSLYWSSTPSRTVWEVASHEEWVVRTFAIVHIVVWICMALSVLTFNHIELLGIPQVLYRSNPLEAQSEKLQRLYSHMRHPMLTLPCVVLWAVPVMTLDRLVLAIFLPLYIIWGCGLDSEDSRYTREQLKRKVKTICFAKDDSIDD